MSITIHDIAREAGVSISTVSKVINGTGKISSATAERVRRIMKDQDFFPSQIARNFVLQASKNISVIMQFGKNSSSVGVFYFEILGGLERVMQQHGYMVSISTIADIADAERMIGDLVKAKRVDGFILHSSLVHAQILPILREYGVPTVIIGQQPFDDSFCTVDIDNEACGRIAMRHLLERGCTDPAFIGGLPGDRISANRVSGVAAELSSRGRILPAGRIVSVDIENRGETFERIRELLAPDRGEAPDSVICTSNYQAALVYRAAREAGIAIPDSLKVIAFDDYPFAPFLNPELTVVDTDLFGLGGYAARTLLRILKKEEVPGHSLHGEPVLIARKST